MLRSLLQYYQFTHIKCDITYQYSTKYLLRIKHATLQPLSLAMKYEYMKQCTSTRSMHTIIQYVTTVSTNWLYVLQAKLHTSFHDSIDTYILWKFYRIRVIFWYATWKCHSDFWLDLRYSDSNSKLHQRHPTILGNCDI